MKTKIISLVVILVLAGVALWYWQNQQIPRVSPSPSATVSSQTYHNDQYGFLIALPDSWKGYTVLNKQWEGRNTTTDYVVEHGPIIMLRHPQWTTANPREDMPVMVFTPDQWAQVQQEKMAVGAAPIPPSILGQNQKYILALPARYNFDYKTGWEEVDQLVHTLKTYEPIPVGASKSLYDSNNVICSTPQYKSPDCPKVITKARNIKTNEIKEFSDGCLPTCWQAVR